MRKINGYRATLSDRTKKLNLTRPVQILHPSQAKGPSLSTSDNKRRSVFQLSKVNLETRQERQTRDGARCVSGAPRSLRACLFLPKNAKI